MQILAEDSLMIVWWGSVVECWSAFARLRREGLFDTRDEEQAIVDRLTSEPQSCVIENAAGVTAATHDHDVSRDPLPRAIATEFVPALTLEPSDRARINGVPASQPGRPTV